MDILELFSSIIDGTVISQFFQGDGWMRLIMIFIGVLFLFLAIKKGFEPYLLIPIAFGIILVNILPEIYITETADGEVERGLLSVAANAVTLMSGSAKWI